MKRSCPPVDALASVNSGSVHEDPPPKYRQANCGYWCFQLYRAAQSIVLSAFRQGIDTKSHGVSLLVTTAAMTHPSRSQEDRGVGSRVEPAPGSRTWCCHRSHDDLCRRLASPRMSAGLDSRRLFTYKVKGPAPPARPPSWLAAPPTLSLPRSLSLRFARSSSRCRSAWPLGGGGKAP